MTAPSRRDLLAAGALGGLALASRATAAPDPFGDRIEAALRDRVVPGLALAMIREGRVTSARGYGWASLDDRTPVTTRTAFHLASVSKVITGAVLMQLWEEHRFGLDDPIAPHLDFAVTHPGFPDRHITFRHLFTHSSGISDAVYAAAPFSEPPLDRLPLRDFLTGYLPPGGRWYDARRCFGEHAPGTTFDYSNVGMALAGYLAERCGGASLPALSATRLFRPLGLHDVAWSPDALGRTPLATAYERRDGGFAAIPPVRYPDYPAGMLRASVADLARLIAAYMPRAPLPILRPETVAAMIEPRPLAGLPDHDFLGQGLFWARYRIGRRAYVAHNGGDPGCFTQVAMTPDLRAGLIVLTNATANKAASRLFAELTDIFAAQLG